MAVASKAWERVVWGNGEMPNSGKIESGTMGSVVAIHYSTMQCNAMQSNAMQWHSPTLEKTLCHAPFLAYGVLGRSPCHPAAAEGAKLSKINRQQQTKIGKQSDNRSC